MLCEALGVSRSGFYAWLTRPRSRRSLSDETLGQQARLSFVESDRTYGARRVWRDVLEVGYPCGMHRRERLMRIQAPRERPRRLGKHGSESCRERGGTEGEFTGGAGII